MTLISDNHWVYCNKIKKKTGDIMGWFKRLKDGIQTATIYKKETPDGVWNKCKSCNEIIPKKKLEESIYVCPSCDHHFRIGSHDYFDLFFKSKSTILFENLKSKDFLNFVDLKSYEDRLVKAREKTNLGDAITVATGKIGRYPITIAAMDFSFIGGSMGSVVGEKISRAIDYCIEHNTPLMIISKSGGARMMESAFSLLQMTKTSAKLAQLAREGIPYFSLLTDPTTGGVTASFAMLGDINFSEPGALIGFAGPRVVKDTIGKDLPDGFQRAEFLLEHGFLDFIVERKDLREKVENMLHIFNEN